MTPDNDNDTGVPPLVEERSARPPLDIAAKPPDDDTLIRDVEGAGTILKSIVSLLELVDWQHLVRGLEAAHTLGPIMDPTAYRDAPPVRSDQHLGRGVRVRPPGQRALPGARRVHGVDPHRDVGVQLPRVPAVTGPWWFRWIMRRVDRAYGYGSRHAPDEASFRYALGAAYEATMQTLGRRRGWLLHPVQVTPSTPLWWVFFEQLGLAVHSEIERRWQEWRDVA